MKYNNKSWAAIWMSAAILVFSWAGIVSADQGPQNADRLREAARLQEQGAYRQALELLNELKDVDLGPELNQQVVDLAERTETSLVEIYRNVRRAQQRYEAEADTRERRDADLAREIERLSAQAAASDRRGDYAAAAQLYERIAVKRATHAFETAESLWNRGQYERAVDIFNRIKVSEVNIGEDKLASIDNKLDRAQFAANNLQIAEEVYMARLEEEERLAERRRRLQQAFDDAKNLFHNAEAAVTLDRKDELYDEFMSAAGKVKDLDIEMPAEMRAELEKMTATTVSRREEIVRKREEAETYLASGQRKVEDGEYEAARELIYDAIRTEALTSQRHSEALELLASVQETINEMREAEKREYEKFAEEKRQELAVREQALELMRRVRQEQEIRAQREKALADNYYKIADEYYMNARFDDALRELDKALRHKPDHEKARELKDEILVLTGKKVVPAATLEIFGDIERVRYEQARAQLTDYVQKGRRMESEGEYELAVDYYRRAKSMLDFLRARFDVAPTEEMINAAITRVQRRMAAIEREIEDVRRVDARREYQDEIRATEEIEIRTIDAMMEKAYQFYAAEQYGDAISQAQNVLARDPGNQAAEEMIRSAREAQRRRTWRELDNLQEEYRKRELLNMKHKLLVRSDLLVFPAQEIWEDIKRRGPVPLPSRLAEKTPRELQLEEALETRISLDYEVPTEMEEILDFINLHVYSEIGVRNPIRLDPRVTRVDPRLVRISLEDAKVRRALALLLTDGTTDDEWAQGNELDLFIYREAGVIYISNKTRLLRLKMREKEFRFYDVRDLLAVFAVGDADDTRDTNDAWFSPDYSGSRDRRLGSSRSLEQRQSASRSGRSSRRNAGSVTRNTTAMNELASMLTQLTGPQNWGRVQVFTGTGDSLPDSPANNNPWAPVGSSRAGQQLGQASWGQFQDFPGMTADAEDVSPYLGTMFMYGTGDLLVEQTPEIHERIEDVLTRLRAMVENQVHVEARFIIFSDEFLESLGVSSITNLSGRHATKESYGFTFSGDMFGLTPLTGALTSGLQGRINFLNSAETEVVLSAVKESRFAVTMQAPALTLMNTEASEIILQTVVSYTSGFEVSEATGTLIPEISTVETSTNLWIRPVISSCRKYVTLEIEPTFTIIEDLVERIFETVVVIGDPPVAVTRSAPYYEPEVTEKTLYARIRVPDRGTAVLGGLSEAEDAWGEGGVPILANLPLIKRLFSTKRERMSRSHQMFLVTPTIMLAEEIEAQIPTY